jgi:Gpi18-like mannosyltransferase
MLVFISAIAGVSFFGMRTLPDVNLPSIQVPFVNLFSRWDAWEYGSIALNGYPPGGSPISVQWSWFPLYPLAMRAVGSLFLGTLPPAEAVMLAGFLISNIFFFVSLMFFYKLSEMVLHNSRLALLSTIFFAFWPGALFYSCVYSESLFIALALGAFYFLEKGQGTKSTILGFLASFTRSNGFLISIPFLFYGLQKRSYKLIFQSILVASPYFWFNLFGYFSTGLFPEREIAVATYWGKTDFLFIQITNAVYYSGTLIPNAQVPGFALLLFVEALLVVFPFVCLLLSKEWHIRPFSQILKPERKASKYWAYSSATLVVILFYSVAFSVQRYAIPMLPLYWVNASLWSQNKKTGILLLAITTTILIIGTMLFATWRQYY